MQGIYVIENKTNKKKYIGQSLNIEDRFWRHKNALNKNNHRNILLQRAWNLDGEKNFNFYILELVETVDELPEREYFWMNKLKTLDREFGYNLRTPENFGHLTEEHKNKIGYAVKGEKNGMFGKPSPFRGKKHSKETRKILKEKAKNRIISEETREKLRIASTGREYSKETREKLSLVNKGRILSEETKKKISQTKKDKKLSQGSNNGRAKLTEDDVKLIVCDLKSGMRICDIVKKHEISRNIINKIKSGETWSHITGGPVIVNND